MEDKNYEKMLLSYILHICGVSNEELVNGKKEYPVYARRLYAIFSIQSRKYIMKRLGISRSLFYRYTSKCRCAMEFEDKKNVSYIGEPRFRDLYNNVNNYVKELLCK